MNDRSMGKRTGGRTVLRPDPANIVRDWEFTASSPSWRTRARRFAAQFARGPAPRHDILRAPVSADRWNCLFLFAPHAAIDRDQQQMLERMRALPGRMMVVIASDQIPPVVDRMAHALIRKDLGGFDFSAYAIALGAIARHAPGAFVYMQNDSVLGPFETLEANLGRMTWDLGGFIGSAAVENHLSSFAFALRDVTPARVASLAPALSPIFAYERHQDVVTMQETRLARMAARDMKVGALWFMPDRPAPPPISDRLRMAFGWTLSRLPLDLSADPALAWPIDLMDQGFPFMKRSLFGKFADIAEPDALLNRLAQEDWTMPPGSGA